MYWQIWVFTFSYLVTPYSFYSALLVFAFLHQVTGACFGLLALGVCVWFPFMVDLFIFLLGACSSLFTFILFLHVHFVPSRVSRSGWFGSALALSLPGFGCPVNISLFFLLIFFPFLICFIKFCYSLFSVFAFWSSLLSGCALFFFSFPFHSILVFPFCWVSPGNGQPSVLHGGGVWAGEVESLKLAVNYLLCILVSFLLSCFFTVPCGLCCYGEREKTKTCRDTRMIMMTGTTDRQTAR